MNKNNLVFDWSEVGAHRGWMGVSILIAVLGLVFFLSVIHVKFDFKQVASVKSASVFYLPDHEDGRAWIMKANEEGPFPGGMEISGMDDPFEEFGRSSFGEDDSWNPYEISMHPLEADSLQSTRRISVQGKRYLPKIFKSEHEVKDQQTVEVELKPVLFPYTKESEKWLPAELPLFHLERQAEIKTTEWRFLLNLSKDGRVRECLLLSGGGDSGSTEISTWLKGLQFQKAAEAERWMGLRVELLNERNYGANPK
jgi:hypothetical protein